MTPERGATAAATAAPRHVGLNLIFLVPGETGGMEIAARELIVALAHAAQNVRFTAFVGREAASDRDAPWSGLIDHVLVPVNSRRRIEWVRGEQLLLPRLAARAGVELVHSLASTAPAWGNFRRVVTVHDLIYARFPEAHAGLRALGMRALVPLAVRRSDRVIVDSNSTREDLVTLLGTPAEKIDVAPLGVRAPSAARPVSERFATERRVLLSLSAKRPHKNLAALIEALALIPPERRPLLMLPGYATWHEAELRERTRTLGVEDDVRWLGWLADDELEDLWSAADAFVFPSQYEGFGLPVLEAMVRGVPVACSNRSALPEVAGEAALLFDPDDPRQIAEAIERLLSDPGEAERLGAAGRERAASFTWQRTAELTLESYRRALAGAA